MVEPRAARRSAGFTMIELLVALALVGLAATLAVGGAARLARTELRGSAGRMASAIRYLFDRASTTGKIHRLVFDFESGKYWAEVSDDRFLLPRERETEESRQKDVDQAALEKEEEKEREKAAAEMSGDEATAMYDFSRYTPTEWKPNRSRFEQFQEKALKVMQVKGAKIAGLFTPRYREPIATGHGYLYFFPLGQTEPAIVHLSDPDGEVFFSLLVHPLNGRVKVASGYVEPRVEEQYDDEGKKIEER